MSEIRTSVTMTDNATPVISRITSALGNLTKNFGGANKSVANFQQASAQAVVAQTQMNNVMNAGVTAAGNLTQKIKALGSAYMGYLGIASSMGFIKEALDLSDVQRNVEVQLQSVLSNVGETMDTFNELKAYAGEIQSKGIYGDEAMIAGAAEFATYMSDKDAIKKMMGTLSNYAMGMTGGGAVDSRQMTQFATQLGMALNGNMAGLSRKGFKMSDAQKEIMKNGTDMQKALVLEDIIGESWDKLYEKMSNTPQGKIIQLQNAIGDMKEVAGDTFYGALAGFADEFTNNLPQIQKVITAITNGLSVVVLAIGYGAKVALSFANVIIDNWGLIAPVITAVGAAWLFATAAETANSVATLYAAACQWVLNSALLACPLTWIVLGLYLIVGAINTFAGTTISATGIIVGAFAVVWDFIRNGLAFVANAFVAFGEFLNNVFVDPLTAIHNLFADIWNGIVDLVGSAINDMLGLIAKLPGMSKFGSGISFGGAKIARRDIAGGIDNSQYKFGYSTGAGSAYEWASNLSNGIKINPVSMANAMGTALARDPATNETAANTGKIAASGEDIKLLREIAERDVINRFTTAEIKVDMTNNNTVSNTMDLDGMVTALGNKIHEQMLVAAEGIHL